ncbi:MAG: hypothetical protein GY705_09730 [Bacteroidetes bacterium]|nr:hypothetical protein [Bacteroidota bacterium]
MYDIIGDIHGHADELEYLLKKLGYEKKSGIYKHPGRQAIFLGDFINRGTQARKSLHLIRPMVEMGYAQTVIGNHEYNLLTFFTYDNPLRPNKKHTIKSIYQISNTVGEFVGKQQEFENFLNWFKTLPIFLELNGIRIVHAAWIPSAIEFIKTAYPQNCLTDKLILKSTDNNNPEFDVVRSLLKGIEINLLKKKATSNNSKKNTKKIRMKWWENAAGKSMRNLAARYPEKVLDIPFPDEFYEKDISYPPKDIPLFMGHYCLNGKLPYLLADNVCCVDFCVTKGKRIVAYRWDGEQSLSIKKFVY